jgi:hypothetical protein
VDNSVPILGAVFTDLGNNYNDLYNETLQHGMNDRTRTDYWWHNIRIAKFWEEHCPEYLTRSEREKYQHKTFKIQESSYMVSTGKT